MLARFKDHATGAFYKGFRLLTIGWSDGHNFLPLDFALLSSRNGQINGMNEKIDKCTIRNEWLALLTTYLTLTVEEVIRIYAIHWDIEVFFKFTTSLLRLQKDILRTFLVLLISHTPIVFSRYILLPWQHRQSKHRRSLVWWLILFVV